MEKRNPLETIVLDKSAAAWVEKTLASMTLEEAVSQLLMPEDRKYQPKDWLEIMGKNPLGCVFVNESDLKRTQACLNAIQEKSRIPVIAAADMEQGLLNRPGGQFPYNMALGAAGSAEFAREKGLITAKQARTLGIHWLFQPVVDLNINFMNPETNVRAFGDTPSLVGKLAAAQIRGMQTGGMVAATAKHFPGAGTDDRDQHLCTSLNRLPMAQWWKSYGAVWKAAIQAGAMSIMPGHIALPHYEGLARNPSRAMPATLNPRLLKDLLRGELSFEGVIVSDAATMIGITSRCCEEDLAIEFIRAGGDVFLFSHPTDDFRRLMTALKKRRLSEQRVYESAKRVLVLKARLGLHKSCRDAALSASISKRARLLSKEIAEASVTVVKGPRSLPVRLKKGARVFTTTIRWPGSAKSRCPELKAVEKDLKARGFEVLHKVNPSHNDLIKAAAEYDFIFINLVQVTHSMIGNIRLVGPMIMPFWRAFYANCDRCVFTSFGSPYHLYEQPHWPNLVVCYSPCEESQHAAVKAWFGELKPRDQLPVKLPLL